MQQVSSSRAIVLTGDAPARSAIWGWTGGIVIVAAVAGPILIQRYAEIDPVMMATFGYAAIFVFGVIGSLTLFLPVPVLTLVFAGATLLNPGLLALTAAAGITIGMAGCYFLGKAGHRWARKAQPDPRSRMFSATNRMTSWYRSHTTVASFFMAAMPNPLFDYAGYIAGLIKVDRNRFLFATFAGKFVQSLVVALLGYYLFEQISTWW